MYKKLYLKYKYKYLQIKYGGAKSNKIENKVLNILIACHNRKVNLETKLLGTVDKNYTSGNGYHWWNNWIREFVEFHFGSNNTINVLTVDVSGTPDIKNDAFSIDFIDKNTNTFDVVVYPDCGGEWFEAMKHSENEMITSHSNIILRILPLVKKGGFAIFHKTDIDKLQQKLNSFGLNVQIESYQSAPNLMPKKNTSMEALVVYQGDI